MKTKRIITFVLLIAGGGWILFILAVAVKAAIG